MAADRSTALAVLARLHAAQGDLYAGRGSAGVREILTADVVWTIPGENAIAGEYRGVDAVLAYMERRRALADDSFRMHPGEILTGDGDHVAALTDGTARIGGVEHRWSTVGLYRLRGGRIAACTLLALDQTAFDRIWSGGQATRSVP